MFWENPSNHSLSTRLHHQQYLAVVFCISFLASFLFFFPSMSLPCLSSQSPHGCCFLTFQSFSYCCTQSAAFSLIRHPSTSVLPFLELQCLFSYPPMFWQMLHILVCLGNKQMPPKLNLIWYVWGQKIFSCKLCSLTNLSRSNWFSLRVAVFCSYTHIASCRVVDKGSLEPNQAPECLAAQLWRSGVVLAASAVPFGSSVPCPLVQVVVAAGIVGVH